VDPSPPKVEPDGAKKLIQPAEAKSCSNSPASSASDKTEEISAEALKGEKEEGEAKGKEEDKKSESATLQLAVALASAEALQVPESPASKNLSPRRKEKRKRKRSLKQKKKEKGNQDLRTHWLLLLTLIVLTCSVFCGIVVVHFIDQGK